MNFTASLRSLSPHAVRSALRFALLLSALFAAQAAVAGGWTLKDTRGVSHNLAQEKGKWVLINFWAPWCPPCLAEMPGFSAMQQKHRDLQVIGVAVMYHNDADVLAVVNKLKLAYPVVLGNDDISSEFGELSGLPTSFLYDPSGKPVGRHEGPLTPQELEHVMAHAPDARGVFVRGD